MRRLPRPTRVFAVARRDLTIELKHRRGWLLPVVMAALLVPTSLVPSPADRTAASGELDWFATGAVPDAVAELQDPNLGLRAKRVHFVAEGDRLRVITGRIPIEVRAALDGDTPALTVTPVPVGMVFPGRSMLFALMATSSLTGALSASVGGERSNRTLVALLTSGLTRLEIVVGKWAAWGGFGAVWSLAAALLAIAVGRIDPGWWLAPLPTVPVATVALGLWLVRRAPDVIAGSTVSLRVLPAALTIAGLVAWLMGRADPHLGALVPLGGALIAAGDTWGDTPTAPLLAAAVSLVLATGWVLHTASDLDEHPPADAPEPTNQLTVIIGTIAAACWWVPIGMAVLWREAGNPLLADGLPIEHGVVAGLIGLGCLLLVRLGKEVNTPHVGPVRSWPVTVGAAIAVGVGLAATGGQLAALPVAGPLEELQVRMADARSLAVVGPGLTVAMILVDELLFRGWLQRAVGTGRSALVWTVVKAPLAPVQGLVEAMGLGMVARRGGVRASVAARLVAAGVGAALPAWAAGSLVGGVVGLVVVGAVVAAVSGGRLRP